MKLEEYLCVYCDKPMVYIFKGISLCRACKEKEVDSTNTADNRLKELSTKYTGRLGLLKAFFKQGKPHIADEVNELFKFKYVSRLIDAIDQYNISPANIDNGLTIAMKMKKFDVGLVIHLMRQRQKADDKTKQDNQTNKVTGFYRQQLEREKNAN